MSSQTCRRARRWAWITLHAWSYWALDRAELPHPTMDDVELVISELVTNAVTHACGPVRARPDRLASGAVRVSVDDGGPQTHRTTRTRPNTAAACPSWPRSRPITARSATSRPRTAPAGGPPSAPSRSRGLRLRRTGRPSLPRRPLHRHPPNQHGRQHNPVRVRSTRRAPTHIRCRRRKSPVALQRNRSSHPVDPSVHLKQHPWCKRPPPIAPQHQSAPGCQPKAARRGDRTRDTPAQAHKAPIPRLSLAVGRALRHWQPGIRGDLPPARTRPHLRLRETESAG
ncbi:hypothetical protein GT002_21795 [Streptomyces sp. SID4917]|uniref:ATP-binding protein n=1 Tax=Streptomyces sp. MnatMP-M17 TaxID=1839780 RepID=UPI00114CDA3E|nr:hypothetical protein [Streptomyces sp. SID4917]